MNDKATPETFQTGRTIDAHPLVIDDRPQIVSRVSASLLNAFLVNPADNPQKQLKKKSVYGAQTHFIAKLRPDLDSWDLRCIDPLVGEFRLPPGDILYFWSEQFGEWLPGREMDLIEMAVAELEKGKG